VGGLSDSSNGFWERAFLDPKKRPRGYKKTAKKKLSFYPDSGLPGSEVITCDTHTHVTSRYNTAGKIKSKNPKK
jgi:hypothetical protein